MVHLKFNSDGPAIIKTYKGRDKKEERPSVIESGPNMKEARVYVFFLWFCFLVIGR